MGFFKPEKKFTYTDVDDPNIHRCLHRGFFPLGNQAYIDVYMVSVSGMDKLIIIPEIEEISENLINDFVDQFNNFYEENGELPGKLLLNIATWMLAWGLEMAWRWNKGDLDSIVFEQDMSAFDVPMDKFQLMPQPWYTDILDAFMDWNYNNSGYTGRYLIDIYDPIRDGYLALIRLAVTKVLPQL